MVRDWWGWTPLCVGGMLALAWTERRRARRELLEGDLAARLGALHHRVATLERFAVAGAEGRDPRGFA